MRGNVLLEVTVHVFTKMRKIGNYNENYHPVNTKSQRVINIKLKLKFGFIFNECLQCYSFHRRSSTERGARSSVHIQV